MRGWRNLCQVELGHLTDGVEDRAELLDQALDLVVGQREPREPRDVQDFVSGNCHRSYGSSPRRRAPCREPATTSKRVRSARRCDDVRGLGTLGTLDDLELHTLAFGQGLEAVHRDRGEVDEDVVPTLALDEAVALLVRKPLDGALLHYCPPTAMTPGRPGRRRCTQRAER